jgi:hypothetical protein
VEPCLAKNCSISLTRPFTKTSKGITSVPRESGIRGTERLCTSKGDAALQWLSCLTCCGAHAMTMKIMIVRTGAGCFAHSSPEARYLGHWGNRTFPGSPVLHGRGFPQSPVLLFSAFAFGTRGEGGSMLPAGAEQTTGTGVQAFWLLGSTNALFLLEPVQLVKILDSCPDYGGPVRVEAPAL